MQAGVAQQLAAALRHDGDRAALLQVLDPLIDDLRVGDIGPQEQQVVVREGAAEVQYRVAVGGLHQAERHLHPADRRLPGIRSLNYAGISHERAPPSVMLACQAYWKNLNYASSRSHRISTPA